MTKLRHGYTTGACAAAAAKGAARMLREQRIVDEIELTLPGGEKAIFRLQGQEFDEEHATCFTVKDAGDDPDVTNGAAIHATLRAEPLHKPAQPMIFVTGGQGIGKVTKPGLAVPVGEPAINPVPLRMITEAVQQEFSVVCLPKMITVKISIPNGEELAKKTLNARLGIVGGLSILGTTGIVRPLSAEAWTATIDSALDVAKASGAKTVILATGRTSELAAQQFLQPRLELPEEAFIMMGDHVGYAFEAAAKRRFPRIILAAQFAKLLKIGCGHRQTHVSSSALDLRELAAWLEAHPPLADLAGQARSANTAREVLEQAGERKEAVAAFVAARAHAAVGAMAPESKINVLVAGYNGEVIHFRAKTELPAEWTGGHE